MTVKALKLTMLPRESRESMWKVPGPNDRQGIETFELSSKV
jgi:hypothetical protein